MGCPSRAGSNARTNGSDITPAHGVAMPTTGLESLPAPAQAADCRQQLAPLSGRLTPLLAHPWSRISGWQGANWLQVFQVGCGAITASSSAP